MAPKSADIGIKWQKFIDRVTEIDMPKKLNVLSVDVLPVIEEHDSNIGEELVSSNAGATMLEFWASYMVSKFGGPVCLIFCIMVKSGGSKSSGGSHHGSDEEEVTMPVFDANLLAGVKDGLESACDYFDKCINQKFTKLERSIAMLVDRLPPPRQAHDRQGRRPPPEHHEYDAEDESPGLRSDGGCGDPEDYLEWEMYCDQIFNSHNYSEDKKVRLASIEFTGYALSWWNQLQLKQGDFSVDAYYKEMELLMSRTGVTENDETTMARFLNGLNDDVKNVLRYHIIMIYKRDGDGCAASKSVSFKPTTPFRDGSKPAASSAIEILMIHLWMMVLKNKNGLSMLARAVQRDGSNVDAKGQRCNIFQLECKIQEKMNQAGTLKITHKVRVAFSIGSYVDKVDCDVVPMNACHLLLGRPWQFDLHATHEGRTNHYSFIHRGVKHVLKPMLDSAIKSMVFSAVKNKKEPCQINPKQRTVLFQGREDDMPKKLNVLSVDVLPVIEEHGSNVGEELVVMLVLDTGRR
uniref:Gag-pol polyprotein n=1 Tax=Oryza sativa subsp. japonica TaxID=39947 RepID=Q7Y1N9_ORYSJ|nr:putative gag-pol polyprotein [Oryza sativa Japonica Group]